jgi:hypothetical protein
MNSNCILHRPQTTWALRQYRRLSQLRVYIDHFRIMEDVVENVGHQNRVGAESEGRQSRRSPSENNCTNTKKKNKRRRWVLVDRLNRRATARRQVQQLLLLLPLSNWIIDGNSIVVLFCLLFLFIFFFFGFVPWLYSSGVSKFPFGWMLTVSLRNKIKEPNLERI